MQKINLTYARERREHTPDITFTYVTRGSGSLLLKSHVLVNRKQTLSHLCLCHNVLHYV